MKGMREPERAVVVGVLPPQGDPLHVAADLQELAALLATAGAQVVGTVVQRREAPDPATFLGRGKVEELRDLVIAVQAGLVACDGELSPGQAHRLEEQLPQGVRVVDRAAVILHIFALRARTREAKTQVELAQLEYLLPRLTGAWQHLSRQAGGIGTRGVGETQLEADRRVIKRRIAHLRRKLACLEQERQVQRQGRHRLPSLALVGYTNAGKSALFQRLTQRPTLVEDRLFATLDPLVRRTALGPGLLVTVADTVGFIRKLPPQLVASFRSTLLEATTADVLLHVVDFSHPAWREQLRVGEEVLESLGVEPGRCLLVLNKVDQVGELPPLPSDRRSVLVSALTGQGLEELEGHIVALLEERGLVEVQHVPLHAGEALQAALRQPRVVGHRFGQEEVELFFWRG